MVRNHSAKFYKIFGRRNQYVTCAKQLINKEGVAIDIMPQVRQKLPY